jgi:hypothetical protein
MAGLSPDQAAVDTDWRLDLNGIKAKDRKQFNADYERANETGDDELLFPWMARVVKAWPYQGDPAEADSYGELGLLELMEVSRRFAEAFRPLGEALRQAANGDEAHSQGHPDGRTESVNPV